MPSSIKIICYPAIVFLALLLFKAGTLTAADTETGVQLEMAKQLGEEVDRLWDQMPPAGTANLRFLFTKDGKPFAGKVSIHGEFTFRSAGRRSNVQAFNPNANGRWVYDEIDPGTYNLSIEGKERFDGWTWSKNAVKVAAGDSPLFEISLDQ